MKIGTKVNESTLRLGDHLVLDKKIVWPVPQTNKTCELVPGTEVTVLQTRPYLLVNVKNSNIQLEVALADLAYPSRNRARAEAA